MKSTLMIVHSFYVITTVHVKTSLVITAMYVGLTGLAGHCDNYLGPLCNSSLCQNGGHCRETAVLNNYTCACAPGYTRRNCEVLFDPCDSSPCQQDGTCSKLGSENFQCSCPSG